MPITHQQIAEKLGVSRTLVTGALHGTRGAGISPETQSLIQRTAREMGYEPRNRTTHTIGYVLPVETLALEAEVSFLMHLQQELGSRGYRLMLAGLDVERPQDLADMLTPKTVDGVIFSRWHGGQVQNALAKSIPWLLTSLEDDVPDDVDLVAMDFLSTLRNLMEYLLGMGHEDFYLIVGAGDVQFHRLVKRGMRTTLAEEGRRSVSLQVAEVMDNRRIAAPLLEALASPKPPTAVIAANPGQAVPALYAARSAGYRIPEDVSFVTLFDVPGVQVLDPQMTATTAGGEVVARRAVERILERIQNPLSPPQQILIPGQVVERESVARR